MLLLQRFAGVYIAAVNWVFSSGSKLGKYVGTRVGIHHVYMVLYSQQE